MWIIRFHLIESRDYNFVERELKKCFFQARKISPIIFAKAIILHKLQKLSWRTIGTQLHTPHIYLFHFYQKYGESEQIKNIFHKFVQRRILLYIEDKKVISEEYLHNSEEAIILTNKKLKTMM